MTFTTIRYPALPENSYKYARVYPPGFGPGEPYYEPDHLRHRPGDTWEIGGKPYDHQDPGPYGTPGWFQDRRTGRHRRSELPDPLPPEEERPSPGPRGRRRLEPDPSYEFTPLQEDAWKRWLIDSAPLVDAHTRPRKRNKRKRNKAVAALIGLIRRFAAVVAGPRETGEEQCHESEPAPGPDRPPVPPIPVPRNGNVHTNAWELHFDAQRPVTGGGAR